MSYKARLIVFLVSSLLVLCVIVFLLFVSARDTIEKGGAGQGSLGEGIGGAIEEATDEVKETINNI